ncbi:FAD-dependent oxidoreductase [Bradyrhizobium sp.]|uniref:FAD-dependent oxidoreductase n=1 Tax=Bradyrhizobium sp. TaxID=376 RepID=UPI002733D4C0|nr:FAD-dependent oxidoreductase [Bradyrhizobium sp.]MDP3691376.1 FAD-dependent oxidoreductase [Bradyrhizobium sp.]
MHHADLRGVPSGYDVIVIGAGAAGMSAALFAAIRGARTLLVEKTGFVGGTSALSAGSIWIPNTRHASAIAAPDSTDKAERYLQQIVGNRADADLRAAFLKAGPEAVEVLENHTDVKLRAYPRHPDYRSELEGAVVAGRALEPLPFDGRLLGDALRLVRPPIAEFTLLGGMMVDRTDIGHLLSATRSMKSLRHAARLLARYGRDRLSLPRGARLVMGNALVGRLLFSLLHRDVDILTDTSLEKIVRDGSGRVTSVVLNAGSVSRDIGIQGGLILAGGGFNRHAVRRRTAWGTDVEWSAVAPGASGDAQDKALEVGARVSERDLSVAFWAPASIRRRRDGSQAVFPHFVLDRGKPGTLVVDSNGRRFVNEAISYHQFALEMLAQGKSAIPAFLIADAAALRKYGLGMVRPGGWGTRAALADGYLIVGATIEQLADGLKIDPGSLRATVERMNGYAETGRDLEFGRGSTVYQNHNGDASAGGANPNLGPIATPPFYALRLYPSDIGTSAGLVTDEAARVLDSGNLPIEGLYACGNDMQSIMGGTYPGPGITLGPALAFAYLAASDATCGVSGQSGASGLS